MCEKHCLIKCLCRKSISNLCAAIVLGVVFCWYRSASFWYLSSNCVYRSPWNPLPILYGEIFCFFHFQSIFVHDSNERQKKNRNWIYLIVINSYDRWIVQWRPPKHLSFFFLLLWCFEKPHGTGLTTSLKLLNRVTETHFSTTLYQKICLLRWRKRNTVPCIACVLTHHVVVASTWSNKSSSDSLSIQERISTSPIVSHRHRHRLSGVFCCRNGCIYKNESHK